MDFHFLVIEKSWKINVEKEGAPCILHMRFKRRCQQILFFAAGCTTVAALQ